MTPERWRQITDIFHSAIARAPSERTAFLAAHCDDDVALRQAVESMIAGHQNAGDFGEPHGSGDAPRTGTAAR